MIVAISSFVASGSVGLRAAHALFEQSRHRLVSVPTVLLSAHLGHARTARHDIPGREFGDIVDHIEDQVRDDKIVGILTGFMPTPAHVAATAGFVRRTKQQSPACLVLVDPIMGDDPDGLYVDPSVADALRDQLVPLADIVTPNRFELAWLSGRDINGTDAAIAAARMLNVETVVATSIRNSAEGADDRLATVGVSADETVIVATPAIDTPAHGTGDLLAAMLLKQRLAGRPLRDAIADAVTLVTDRLTVTGDVLDIDLSTLSNADRSTKADVGAVTGWIVGVDGCPGGWVAVSHPRHEPKSAKVAIHASFEDVLSAYAEAAMIAVDIPIGLADSVGVGGRTCDAAARVGLGARKSSVFSMPSRAAVFAGTYDQACAAALATSDPPRKISKQAFNLFEKIREVDGLMSPDLQTRVVECHPERVFLRLNGGVPLSMAKKVKSRPNLDGLSERISLLRRIGYDGITVHGDTFRRRGAGFDDVVDAFAAAAVAEAILDGTARRVPETPATDARGLRMEIWG